MADSLSTVGSIRALLPDAQMLVILSVRIAATIVVAFLIQRMLFFFVGRFEMWVVRLGHGDEHARRRAAAIGQMLRNLCNVIVVGGVIVHVLALFGWDVRPLLAGAGILGVALGFGAQTLVRDVIAGVFIIAEDQFGVGDVIEVNGRIGTVEALTVRATTLRDFNGFLLFVPNGEMKIVINRSREWNRVAVDVPIAAGQDLDTVLEVCRKVAGEVSGLAPWRERLMGDIEVWGIETLGAQEVSVRFVIRTAPGGDVHNVARELRRRVHDALTRAGVRLAPPREAPLVAPRGAHDPLAGSTL
jgi:small conductance mechanosensitive channel